MLAKKRIISIEGNIGSGKSTLIEKLKLDGIPNTECSFLDEPVDEWLTIKNDNGQHILSKFYENKEKYSFPFQMMAYISRLHKLKQGIKEYNTVFTERSLSTDKYVFAKMLYESDMMDTFEYQIYNKWFDAFNEETAITHVVYVKTDPKICYQRIAKRARDGEQLIPQSYLNDCHRYHEQMIQQHIDNGCKVLVLDGNSNVFDESTYKSWYLNVVSFINHTDSEHNENNQSIPEESLPVIY